MYRFMKPHRSPVVCFASSGKAGRQNVPDVRLVVQVGQVGLYAGAAPAGVAGGADQLLGCRGVRVAPDGLAVHRSASAIAEMPTP